MREIDVAHEAEDKREAARDQEIETRQRHAVQDRADERLLAAEQPSSQSGQMPNIIQSSSAPARRPTPIQTCRAVGPAAAVCDGKAHAVSRRRCSFIFGALWNSPSFMMARMRDLVLQHADVGGRIAVDEQHVGKIARLDLPEFVAHAHDLAA